MQKIIIVGNLGADPTVKTFEDGGKIANFNVGVTERGFKTQSGVEVPEHTEWFRCVAKQNGTCKLLEQYIKKGNKVCVVGKLKTRKYDKEGQEVSITELIVDELEPLTAKGQSDGSAPTNPAPSNQQPIKEDDSTLPF